MERKRKITLQEAYLKWAESRRDKDFTTVYNLLVPSLNGHLYKYIPDNDERSMIISNTMEKIWTNIDRYQPEYQFSTWCFTIALNETRSNWRESNKMPKTNLDMTAELVNDDAYEEFDQKLYDKAVEVIIDLDGREGEALMLREIHRMRYEDIASQMDVPLNSVKTWIRRGRAKVKQSIS